VVAVKLAQLARIYKVRVTRFMIAFIGLELAKVCEHLESLCCFGNSGQEPVRS
jgi:hypothetical protein